MNNSLGIFFGPKTISLAETRGKELINSVQIDRSNLVSAGLDEKVPEEIKLIALFKDEIRKNKIEAKEAGLALSGNDLIVRTFEMPLLAPHELKRAINFEVKKYIPFKLEDLVADSQIRSDKMSRKNLVLFVGIKKDVLNKYLTVLKQLDITLTSIEYSPFSVLRFSKMAGAGTWGTNAIVSAGLKEDEANFMILENGFPLFSRDISLADIVNIQSPDSEAGKVAFLERLKTELRFSFDFYRRKFPSKKIKKVFFLINPDYRQEVEPFMKEI
ncbi:MAG: pilus assembly protein PilM, partial [Candidatus Omnitrophica bacterium]|nr:pilus assembly protein PilM [Candidatus Omnitrophota bacterium]